MTTSRHVRDTSGAFARPSSHKAQRQQEKAMKISDLIWSLLTPDQRCSHGIADAVRGRTPAERLEWAKAAGAHAASRPADSPPSDETWAIVARRIAVMGGWARAARESVA